MWQQKETGAQTPPPDNEHEMNPTAPSLHDLHLMVIPVVFPI